MCRYPLSLSSQHVKADARRGPDETEDGYGKLLGLSNMIGGSKWDQGLDKPRSQARREVRKTASVIY